MGAVSEANAYRSYCGFHRTRQAHQLEIIMNEITGANVTTSLVEYKGNPVCTTRQLSEFYGCDENSIQQNFVRNTDRFEEGKHFVKLGGDGKRQPAQRKHCDQCSLGGE